MESKKDSAVFNDHKTFYLKRSEITDLLKEFIESHGKILVSIAMNLDNIAFSEKILDEESYQITYLKLTDSKLGLNTHEIRIAFNSAFSKFVQERYSVPEGTHWISFHAKSQRRQYKGQTLIKMLKIRHERYLTEHIVTEWVRRRTKRERDEEKVIETPQHESVEVESSSEPLKKRYVQPEVNNISDRIHNHPAIIQIAVQKVLHDLNHHDFINLLSQQSEKYASLLNDVAKSLLTRFIEEPNSIETLSKLYEENSQFRNTIDKVKKTYDSKIIEDITALLDVDENVKEIQSKINNLPM